MGAFRSAYEYKIEYKYDFSNLVLILFNYDVSNQSCINSLLFNWSVTGGSKRSGNVIGLKFEIRIPV